MIGKEVIVLFDDNKYWCNGTVTRVTEDDQWYEVHTCEIEYYFFGLFKYQKDEYEFHHINYIKPIRGAAL